MMMTTAIAGFGALITGFTLSSSIMITNNDEIAITH